MRVGTVKETKVHEYRVGLTPESVRELCLCGHEVLVERNAGKSAGFSDEDYERAGARILASAAEVFAAAELVVKVKEPQPAECDLLRDGQALFTYLHLAAERELTAQLLDKGVTAIAYETVTDAQGGLPLLAPMSEIAGRMAIQAGAHHLEIGQGGIGKLLSGVTGVAPGRVVIIGGGVVGDNAARMAVGMGADVVILDKSLDRLRWLESRYFGRARCLHATTAVIEEYAARADLVIGAVLIPGGSAPKVLSREVISRMRPGSVVVDVAIDQGGCFETSRMTSHGEPTYIVDGVVHYCVSNIPGAVPRTATKALNNATLPFVLRLANEGIESALGNDAYLGRGLNVCQGNITHPAVAEALDLPCQPPEWLHKTVV